MKSELGNLKCAVFGMKNEVAGLKIEVGNLRSEVTGLRGRFDVLIWAVGTNAAATIAILGVLLWH